MTNQQPHFSTSSDICLNLRKLSNDQQHRQVQKQQQAQLNNAVHTLKLQQLNIPNQLFQPINNKEDLIRVVTTLINYLIVFFFFQVNHNSLQQQNISLQKNKNNKNLKEVEEFIKEKLFQFQTQDKGLNIDLSKNIINNQLYVKSKVDNDTLKDSQFKNNQLISTLKANIQNQYKSKNLIQETQGNYNYNNQIENQQYLRETSQKQLKMFEYQLNKQLISQNDSQQLFDQHEIKNYEEVCQNQHQKNKQIIKLQQENYNAELIRFVVKNMTRFYLKTKMSFPAGFDLKLILYNKITKRFKIDHQLLLQNLNFRQRLIKVLCRILKNQYPWLSMFMQGQIQNLIKYDQKEQVHQNNIIFSQIKFISEILTQKKLKLIDFITKLKQDFPSLFHDKNMENLKDEKQTEKQFMKQCETNNKLLWSMLRFAIPNQPKYNVLKIKITNSQNENLTLNWIETELIFEFQIIFQVLNYQKSHLLDFCDYIIRASENILLKSFYSHYIFQLICLLSTIYLNEKQLKEDKKTYKAKIQRNLKIVKTKLTSQNKAQPKNEIYLSQNRQIIELIQQTLKKRKDKKKIQYSDKIIVIETIFKLFKEKILNENNFEKLLEEMNKVYPQESQQNIYNRQINKQMMQKMLKFFALSFIIVISMIKLVIKQSKNQKLLKFLDKISIFKIKIAKIQQILNANITQIYQILNPFLKAQKFQQIQGIHLNKLIEQIQIYIKEIGLPSQNQQKRKIIPLLQQIIQNSSTNINMLNLNYLKSAGTIIRKQKGKFYQLQRHLQIQFDYTEESDDREDRYKFKKNLQQKQKFQIGQIFNQIRQMYQKMSSKQFYDQFNQYQRIIQKNEMRQLHDQVTLSCILLKNYEQSSQIYVSDQQFFILVNAIDNIDILSSTTGYTDSLSDSNSQQYQYQENDSNDEIQEDQEDQGDQED